MWTSGYVNVTLVTSGKVTQLHGLDRSVILLVIREYWFEDRLEVSASIAILTILI